MFFDTNSPQTNNQNVNLSNPISIGSWGADASGFSPTNEASAEFKASTDVGASVGVGVGGSASAGAVGMTRGETTTAPSLPSFDGYLATDNKQQIYMYIGLGVTALIALISLIKVK